MKNMKKVLILLLLIIVMAPESIFAENAIDPTSSSSPPCNGYDWCYDDFALRFSLYKYEGGKLTFYNSKDYKTYYGYGYYEKTDSKGKVIKDSKGNPIYELKFGTSIESVSARIAYESSSWKNSFGEGVNSYGKVWYTKGGKTVKWTTNKYKLSSIINTSIIFPTLIDCPKGFTSNSTYCDYKDSLKNKISKQFGIDGTSINSDAVASKVNSFFGLTSHKVSASDVSNLYITVEPTFLFFNKTGSYYYGTIYEILNLNFPGESITVKDAEGNLKTISVPAANAYNGGYFLGLNGNLYYIFMLTLKASSPTGGDPNNFVSDKNNAVVKIVNGNLSYGYDVVLKKVSNSQRAQNRSDFGKGTTANNGYGIGVYWLGEKVSDCSGTCGGKTGIELLKCAEKYCESNESGSSEKRNCILNKCKYNEPKKTKCDSICPEGTNKKTCVPSSEYTNSNYCFELTKYYKAVCTEKTKVSYNNSLPTVLGYGMGGFNYTLGVNGSRNCDIVFNGDLYTFEYAALKRNKRDNSEPEKALQSYINIFESKTRIKNIDYVNLLDEVTLIIGSEKQIIESKTPKASEPFLTISQGESKDGIKKYGFYKVSDGSATYSSVKNTKYYTEGSSIYELSRQCLSLKDGEIKPACSLTSELKAHEQYYGYYNLIKDTMKVDVVATIKKDTSCLDETNSCHFIVDDNPESASCSVSDGKLVISNINAASLEYTINGSVWRQIGDYDSKNPPRVTGLAQIRYKTASGITVTQTCPVNNTCKKTFKGTEYDLIRDYCNKNYLSDGHSSSESCFKSCSKSCKATVKCSDKNAVSMWCKLNKTAYGYTTEEQCINDCSCSGSSQYIYRPISTENPFPGKDRKVGSNWVGFEDIAKTNALTNKNPIYVIKLDAKTIKAIKTNTASRGKYVYKDFSEYKKISVDSKHKGLNLKSIFIDEHKTIFTCINGKTISNDKCPRLQGGGE